MSTTLNDRKLGYRDYNFEDTEVQMDKGDNERSLQRKQEIFDRKATKIMQKWFLDNIQHPYINKKDKQELCEQTGLSKK